MGGSAQITCQIRASDSGDNRRLQAVIAATGQVSGTYTFVVSRDSPSREVIIDRGGPFKVQSEQPSTIDEAILNLGHPGAYSARLTAEWPGGSSSCSTAFSRS